MKFFLALLLGPGPIPSFSKLKHRGEGALRQGLNFEYTCIILEFLCVLFPLFLADIPASGQLHEIMTVSYTVQNRTTLVQEVEARMGQSEAFMYSGNRLVSIA